MTHLSVLLAGEVTAIAVGVAAQRVLARRKDEPLLRAWARTSSWRLALGGVAGAIIVTSDLVVARVGGEDRAWSRVAPVAIPLGAGFAAWDFRRMRTNVVDEGVTHGAAGEALDDSEPVAVGRAVAIGTCVSVGLYAAAVGEKMFAGGVSSAVTAANPRLELIGLPIGHAIAFSVVGFAGYKGLQYVFRSAETSGGAIEAAHSAAPTSDYISGGPRSAVPADTIGREGRRFVNMALTAEEIDSVMGGSAKPPIRVFVGLETTRTVSGRADLAMRELEALGAFERSHIVFMARGHVAVRVHPAALAYRRQSQRGDRGFQTGCAGYHCCGNSAHDMPPLRSSGDSEREPRDGRDPHEHARRSRHT